jgi:CxxC motif-containing protein (DUF1111 family)
MGRPQFSKFHRYRPAAFALLLAGGVAGPALGQTDPGVRGGSPGAGGPLAGLGTLEVKLFNAAQIHFETIDSVSGTISGEDGSGLGTAFNLNSCAGCHAQPAVGGTSPAVNPELRVATLDGATNTIPSFVRSSGPALVPRFIDLPGGGVDGSVHDLFVITGRTDASGCTATQPNFAQAIANNNIVFRIPTPLFGVGQIENTPDVNLIADSAANASNDATFGIVEGDFNISPDTGNITTFGWKAQGGALEIFGGLEFSIQQGVSSELFPKKRSGGVGCGSGGQPEDTLNLVNPGTTGFAPSDFSTFTENFGDFMRLTAGPTPAPATAATTAGEAVFLEVGCALCHIPSHVTGASSYTNQSFVTYSPFSDFALHDMGAALADHIVQGGANGNHFRTAPLWGIGQRIFFLHDGRTTDLVTAIADHSSSGSEANTVIANLSALSVTQQQDLLDFLRSL